MTTLFLPLWLLAGAAVGHYSAWGEESGERTEESFIPNYAVAGSYFSWSDEAAFSRDRGGVSRSEAGVEANLPLFQREGFRITGGVKYRQDWLEVAGGPAPLRDLDFDLYQVDLPFNLWVDLSDRWRAWVRLQPGLSTDFGSIDGDDFMLTALALLSWEYSERLKIAVGAYYSRDLGEERILPAAGIIWEPGDQWSIGLTMPRLEIAYAPTRDWLLALRCLPAGGGWNIDDPSGSGRDVDLEVKIWRAGLGIDRRLSGAWWAYLDAGLQFGQEITLDGGSSDLTRELDETPYVTGGVRLRF